MYCGHGATENEKTSGEEERIVALYLFFYTRFKILPTPEQKKRRYGSCLWLKPPRGISVYGFLLNEYGLDVEDAEKER